MSLKELAQLQPHLERVFGRVHFGEVCNLCKPIAPVNEECGCQIATFLEAASLT